MENENTYQLLVFLEHNLKINDKECRTYEIYQKIDDNKGEDFFTSQELESILKHYSKECKLSLKLFDKDDLPTILSQYEKEHGTKILDNFLVDIWCKDKDKKYYLLNTWDNSIREAEENDKAAIIAYTFNPKFLK
jgi:hypothetical protein